MSFEELQKSNLQIEPGEILCYAKALMAPDEIDHHGSSEPAIFHDLYLKDTPVSRFLVSRLTTRSLLSSFRSQIDGCKWYELPFCYNE